MQNIVILDKTGDVYNLALLNGYTPVRAVKCGINDIINSVSKGACLLNASLEAGKLKEDCGSLERLKDKNGVSPRILLAEMETASGRTIGYVVLNKAGEVTKIRKDDLLKLCAAAKQRGVAYLQNGIFKEVDGVRSISCYPNKPFNKLTQAPAKKTAESAAPQVDRKANVEAQKENKYTPEQLAEHAKARENGVNVLLISNPKLSPEQMRVLWVSKKRRIGSEYFANPRFSVDAMKFFADRLVSKKMFNDCKAIINPKYSVDQLVELYLGIYAGIDVSEYMDEMLTSSQMYDKRIELEDKLFGTVIVEHATDRECMSGFIERAKRGK